MVSYSMRALSFLGLTLPEGALSVASRQLMMRFDSRLPPQAKGKNDWLQIAICTSTLEDNELPDLKLTKRDGDVPLIKAGSVVRLVERLTWPKYPDFPFQNAFLLTYRSFLTPAELLGTLPESAHALLTPIQRRSSCATVLLHLQTSSRLLRLTSRRRFGMQPGPVTLMLIHFPHAGHCRPSHLDRQLSVRRL